jgi:flagellar biosynthesis protein FliQ
MLAELMSLWMVLITVFLMSLLTQVQGAPLSFCSRVLALLLMVVLGLLLWLP